MSKTKRNQDLFAGKKELHPLTEGQAIAKHEFLERGSNVGMFGYAGTGKSYLACALAVERTLAENTGIHIFRSAVAVRDIGFLPGDEEEKVAVHERPYGPIFSDILRRGDAYGLLKNKGILDFESTSFLRGITIDNSTIIVDEIQNMTMAEVNTIMTRVGKNCKVILCGDHRQTDLRKSSIHLLRKVLTKMQDSFIIVEMEIEDIVRSQFVKSWVVALEQTLEENENVD